MPSARDDIITDLERHDPALVARAARSIVRSQALRRGLRNW